MSKLFIYGTLKRGKCGHNLLTGATFIGEVITLPRYKMLNKVWYPVLVDCEQGNNIRGELWEVPDFLLFNLGEYEGSEFERKKIDIENYDECFAYFYIGSVDELEECRNSWG